jgi:hypothetical protein
MLRYQSLKQRSRCFLSFTSLKVEEFDQLVTIIRSDWIKRREERLTPIEKRKRREGGGRKYALIHLEDWLLLTLVWVRLYPAYIILEYLFNVDESTVSRVIMGTLPLLKDRFTLPKRLPKKKVTTLEELKKYLPPEVDLDAVLADATEQVILRPKDQRKRKPYHSGKQQDFTEKTQIATTRKGYILHVSDSIGGRRHDYTLFKRSRLPQVIPKDVPLYVDTGFQGVRKDYPDLHVEIPFKRKRGRGDLSRSQKIYNKKQRRVRIRVENTIAQLKKYQILLQTYRHFREKYNSAFRFVANVLDFRMLSRGLA